jgi:hypothetical protein
MRPKKVLDEIGLGSFISDAKELSGLTNKIRAVLKAQTGSSHAKHVNAALSFMETLWDRYCKGLAEMYSGYVGFEGAIFGLEGNLDERTYRDHFVHMFNTFVLGLRFISIVLTKVDDSMAQRLFKVRKETVSQRIPSFPKEYDYKERLYYLWVLISTFHDIGIPIEHLERIGTGMSTFIQHFGWALTPPVAASHPFDSSLLHAYLTMLSCVYGGKLACDPEGDGYRREAKPCHYLVLFLGRAFDEHDHGVVGAFLMWRLFETIFLDGKVKHPLTVDEFNAYRELISEQDNARAALAISLHNLKADESRDRMTPKVFPLEFRDYPLTFLLILVDELQEYLRWEGRYEPEAISINGQPELEVQVDDGAISCQVKFEIPEDADDRVWNRIRRLPASLSERLRFDDSFTLQISIKSGSGIESLLPERPRR